MELGLYTFANLSADPRTGAARSHRQRMADLLEEARVAEQAGLDVFADEPRVPERLIALPHVVLAPHIGSATVATRQAMADLAFGNLRAHFTGQPLLTPVPECR